MTYWVYMGFAIICLSWLVAGHVSLVDQLASATSGVFIVYRWSRPATGSSNDTDHGIRTGEFTPSPDPHSSTRKYNPVFDAVIVPSIRGSESVLRAAATARTAEAVLVVLASGNTTPGEVTSLLRSHGWPEDGFLVVDAGAGLPAFCGTTTNSDVSAKRNFGLALANSMGWKTVLFMDDDVEALTKSELRHTADLLHGNDRDGQGRRAVGWAFDRFRDFSIVGHAFHHGTECEPSFAGAGALAVDCTAPIPFFPAAYNEDLLFTLELLRADAESVCVAGTLRQDSYRPFDHSARAAEQEFGDVLTQGLYSLLTDEPTLETAKEAAFWESVLADRQAMQTATAGRLDALGVEDGADCVRAARAQHADDWPDMLARYVATRDYESLRWQTSLDSLPRASSLTQATNILSGQTASSR